MFGAFMQHTGTRHVVLCSVVCVVAFDVCSPRVWGVWFQFAVFRYFSRAEDIFAFYLVALQWTRLECRVSVYVVY